MKVRTEKEFNVWGLKKLQQIQKVLLLDDYFPLRLERSSEPHVSKCLFNYPYKSITVKYAEDVFEDYQKGDLEAALSVLVHEMCHPITDPLYSKAMTLFKTESEVEDERERLTDHLANIVLRNKLI